MSLEKRSKVTPSGGAATAPGIAQEKRKENGFTGKKGAARGGGNDPRRRAVKSANSRDGRRSVDDAKFRGTISRFWVFQRHLI